MFMEMVLAQCPGLDIETPPIGIACLTSYLKSEGYDVLPFDINIELFSSAKKNDRQLWNSKEEYWFEQLIGKRYFRRKMNFWVKKILNSDAKLIGFSLFGSNESCTLELIEKIKDEDKNRFIVVGGPECFISNDKLMEKGKMDIVVIGEGEKALLEIAKKIKKREEIGYIPGTIIRKEDKVIHCGSGQPIKNLDDLPFPDFSSLPLKSYTSQHSIPIYGSRGCFMKCEFCMEHVYWKTYRYRSAKNIFEEMKLRFEQGYNDFRFTDSLINGNIEQLKSLCENIIKSDLHGKISFGGQFRCRPEMDRSLLSLLKKSGCVIIVFGVESGSQQMLDRMKKGYVIDVIEKNLKDCYEVKLPVHINLVVGFPGENKKTIEETLEFLKRNHEYLYKVEINALNIFSNTILAEKVPEYGIIDDKFYRGWGCQWNNRIWRAEICFKIFKLLKKFGIRTKFSVAKQYFIPMIWFAFEKEKNYKKTRKLFVEAIKYCEPKEVEQLLNAKEIKIDLSNLVGKYGRRNETRTR